MPALEANEEEMCEEERWEDYLKAEEGYWHVLRSNNGLGS